MLALLVPFGTLVPPAVAELVDGQEVPELGHLLVAAAPVLAVAGGEVQDAVMEPVDVRVPVLRAVGLKRHRAAIS